MRSSHQGAGGVALMGWLFSWEFVVTLVIWRGVCTAAMQ